MTQPGNERDDGARDHADGPQPGHAFGNVVPGWNAIVLKPPLPGLLVEDRCIPFSRDIEPSVGSIPQSHRTMMPKERPLHDQAKTPGEQTASAERCLATREAHENVSTAEGLRRPRNPDLDIRSLGGSAALDSMAN